VSAAAADFEVIVIGGGVVGAAVALNVSRAGRATAIVEAEYEFGRGASGNNSGILHTGFDSTPGELETQLILRAAQLRNEDPFDLDAYVVRCGAELRPDNPTEADSVRALAANAAANGVETKFRDDGVLEVPGESITDPVDYTHDLLSHVGAETARITSCRIEAIGRRGACLVLSTGDGGGYTCTVAVNCAGVRGDEVAHMAGDETFEIYPRKGEFFIFDPPGGKPLERILLPVPSPGTKGVLVFPTVHGKVVAGPTAHDQVDKDDLSVRPEAFDEVMAKAVAMYPPLEGAEPIASRACLRPAGCGINYVIGPSEACPQLVNVAAIRSTGLSASLGIGEYVAAMVEEML